MPRIEPVPYEELDPELRRRFDAGLADGRYASTVSQQIRAYARNHAISTDEVSRLTFRKGLLEPRLLELIRVRSAQIEGCEPCLVARGEPTVIGEDDVASMLNLEAGGFTSRERMGLRFVELFCLGAHAVRDDTFRELATEFTTGEIVELGHLCSRALSNHRWTYVLDIFGGSEPAIRYDPAQVDASRIQESGASGENAEEASRASDPGEWARPRIEPIPYDELDPELRRRFDAGLADGRYPFTVTLQVYAYARNQAIAIDEVGLLTFRKGLLEPRLAELLRIRSSQINGCEPCAVARKEPEVISEEDVACMLDLDGGEFTNRERLALRFDELVCLEPHAITDDTFHELAREFTTAEIVELTSACTGGFGIHRWTNMLDIFGTSGPVIKYDPAQVNASRAREAVASHDTSERVLQPSRAR